MQCGAVHVRENVLAWAFSTRWFRFYTLMSIFQPPHSSPSSSSCPQISLFFFFSPQLSSLLHILSLAPASMQEWEVLLGDRLAPSFQEAESRPWLSGCKNKQKKKEKTVLEGKRTSIFHLWHENYTFCLPWNDPFTYSPPRLFHSLISRTLHPEVVQK